MTLNNELNIEFVSLWTDDPTLVFIVNCIDTHTTLMIVFLQTNFTNRMLMPRRLFVGYEHISTHSLIQSIENRLQKKPK